MLKVVLRLSACLCAILAIDAALATVAPADASAAAVVRGYPLNFPRDYGAHNEFRTEWWYITGWLHTRNGAKLGFQVTFFRSRTSPDLIAGNPSAFAPTQILIAHCALSDPTHGRLRQAQRIARAGLGVAYASEADTQVSIDRWQLQRTSERYIARVQGENFSLQLTMLPTQPPLLNGDRGFSQKSPLPRSASYYYSVPHLQVAGTVEREGAPELVTGEAWLDHEWSSEYLDADASGWDWIGMNFDDGSALMAFRIRAKDGAQHWAAATLRDGQGNTRVLNAEEIRFTPLRHWRSQRTGISYPVEWRVRAGPVEFELQPLLEDQENDTRATTGAIYWEGAVTATRAGHSIGRGYLELTGYGEALKLR